MGIRDYPVLVLGGLGLQNTPPDFQIWRRRGQYQHPLTTPFTV